MRRLFLGQSLAGSRLPPIGRPYATDADGSGRTRGGRGKRRRGRVGAPVRQGAAPGRRPFGGGDHDGHRCGQSAVGGAGRRPDPRAGRQRHRRGDRRERHDGADGTDRQRHRRRPVHPLLRREDRHGTRSQRERLGADGPHAGVPGSEGHHQDAAARHLLGHRARRRCRMGRHAHEVRLEAVLGAPGAGDLLRRERIPRARGRGGRMGTLGEDAQRASEFEEDVPARRRDSRPTRRRGLQEPGPGRFAPSHRRERSRRLLQGAHGGRHRPDLAGAGRHVDRRPTLPSSRPSGSRR